MSFKEHFKKIIFGQKKEKAEVPEAMVQEVHTDPGERVGTAIPGMVVHNVGGTRTADTSPSTESTPTAPQLMSTPSSTPVKDPVAEAMKSITETEPDSVRNTKEKLVNEDVQQTPPAPPVPSTQIPPIVSPLTQQPATPADSLPSSKVQLSEEQSLEPSLMSIKDTIFDKGSTPFGAPRSSSVEGVQDSSAMNVTKDSSLTSSTMRTSPPISNTPSKQQPEIPTNQDTTPADALREKYSEHKEPFAESANSVPSPTAPRPLADMLQEAAQAPHIPSVKLPEETKIAEELVAEVKSPEGHADAIGKVLDDLAYLQKEGDKGTDVSNSKPEQITVVADTILQEAKATPPVASNDNTREKVLEVPSLQNRPLQKDGEEKDSEHTLEGAVKNIKVISQQIPQVAQTEVVEIKEDKKENTANLPEEMASEGFARDVSFEEMQQEIRIILDEEGDAHLRDALEHLLDKEALRSALLKITNGTSDVPVINNTPEQTHEYTTNNEPIEEVSMPTAYETSRAIKEANDNAQKQNNYGEIKNAQEKVEHLLAT